jgi:hypothetical protein
MTVRDRATVTVTNPVDGTKRRRSRQPKRTLARTEKHIVPDKRVMEAIAQIKRPGERVKVVSATEVWLVPMS